MARPIKKGLSYFPLDVDLFSDIKIKIVRGRYGSNGVLLYLYLLCEIYKNGYYLTFSDDLMYVIMADLNLGENETRQILNFLLERSLFNDKLFKSDKVLTAKSIQSRYQEAKKGSKRDIEVERKFWVLSENDTLSFIKVYPKINNSEKNKDFSRNNTHNSEINSTKESKEKESKVKESKREYADFVRLTLSEHQSLIDEFGELDAKRCIDELSLWKKKKGSTKSIDDCATIKRWVIDRVKELKAKGRYDSDDSSFNADDVERNIMKKYRRNNET